MKRGRILGWLLAGSLLLAAAGAAKLPKPESVVQVRVEPAQVKVKAGKTAGFTVVATILEGFHLNSNQPVQEYLIPTRVELVEATGFELERADYPAGEMKSFGFAGGEELSVYEGTVKVPVRLRAKRRATTGVHRLRLAFHFQACNDRICLRPARHEVQLTVRVQ